MSLPDEIEEIASNSPAEPARTWIWLGFAAVLVAALVVGFLHAGRSFWKLSDTAPGALRSEA